MGAFALGWQSAHDKNVAQRDRKQALGDEERKLKVADLYEQRNAIREKLSTLPADSPAYAQAHQDAQASIANIQTELEQLYHPTHAPGALQKDWNFLSSLITRRKSEPELPAPTAPVTTTTTPDAAVADPATLPTTIPGATYKVGGPAGQVSTTTTPDANLGGPSTAPVLPGATYKVKGPAGAVKAAETMAIPTAKLQGLVAPGNIPIWNRPVVQNEDGSHSSEFSTSFTDENPKSPYYGKEVLVPTVVDGKFLTPDGKKPPEGSPAEKAMLEKARENYERTGQHLGIFQSPDNADQYADMLHNRGEKKRPNPNSYQTPLERKTQAGREKAEQAAEQFLQASPPSDAQKALSEARAQIGAQKAKIDAAMEEFDKDHPDASKDERENYKNRIFENVAGFKSATLGAKWVYKTAKVNGQPTTVRYNEKDPSGGMQYANGAAIADDANVQLESGKVPPGMTYDKTTGQVWDKAKNIRYNADDPNNPPEVQAMFRGHDIAQAQAQAYGLRLTQERGQSYNNSKAISVLDTKNGNRPTEVRFDAFQAEPGRYIPSTAGAKALAQVNMFEDIGRTSRAARDSILDLKEDFPEDMKAKIAVALSADDHGTALGALMSSAAMASLTPDQFGFLVATRQLAENAMAMRSILGAGQGSEDVRRAIQSTLPSLLSPNRKYALMQLDAFDKTLEQLHRGIQSVPLGQAGWTVAGGENQQGAPAPSGGGGTQQPKTKGSRSIAMFKKAWQAQPENRGKTITDDQAKQLIIQGKYTPTP